MRFLEASCLNGTWSFQPSEREEGKKGTDREQKRNLKVTGVYPNKLGYRGGFI